MEFWSFVYAIGAAQAMLLALALWRRPVNAAGNRVLAAWIAVVGVDLAVKAGYFGAPGPDWLKPFRFVGLFPFFYGSAFYLYVRTLADGRGPRWRDSRHLAGFALALAANANVFLYDRAQTHALYARLIAGDGWPQSPWLDVLLFGIGVSYVAAALLRSRRYRRRLRDSRSDADAMSLRWIDAMAWSQIVIWCIALAQWLWRIPWIDYPLIYGALAAWVFLIGYLSLTRAAIVPPPPVPADRTDAALADDPRFPQVAARLSQLMTQERLYREPALTIGQLARRSGYPEYLVSAVINRRFDGHFWDYINRQRIDAASAHLADANDARTILEIAYACGFTSKSTFNAAFKRRFGQTPSAYRQDRAADARATDAPSDAIATASRTPQD